MRSTYLRIRQVSDPDVPDSPSGTPDSYAQELVVVPKKKKVVPKKCEYKISWEAQIATVEHLRAEPS